MDDVTGHWCDVTLAEATSLSTMPKSAKKRKDKAADFSVFPSFKMLGYIFLIER